MARITHPRPLPGRQTFIGIEFIDGLADVDLDPITEAALIQHGYGIETEHVVGSTLESLTVPELRDSAKELGIEFDSKTKKADLIALIEASPRVPVITDNGVFEVGQIVALTDEAIDLIGGDKDSRAEILELTHEGAAVRWLTPSESAETTISLGLITAAPQD